jgi:hypothetical protein
MFEIDTVHTSAGDGQDIGVADIGVAAMISIYELGVAGQWD